MTQEKSDTEVSQTMEKANAIRRIEEVEEKLADAVRQAKEDVEETTENPVVVASEIDDLRRDLTDARADLVDALMEEELDDDSRR